MSDNIKLQIVTNQKFNPLRFVATLAYVVVVIGIGIAMDSAAMQWIGFIIVVLTALGLAMSAVNDDKNLTIDEAMQKLIELKAKEARK